MKIYFTELNFYEKILVLIFKRYTYKIYKKGYIDGFNMKNEWYFARLYKGCTYFWNNFESIENKGF